MPKRSRQQNPLFLQRMAETSSSGGQPHPIGGRRLRRRCCAAPCRVRTLAASRALLPPSKRPRDASPTTMGRCTERARASGSDGAGGGRAIRVARIHGGRGGRPRRPRQWSITPISTACAGVNLDDSPLLTSLKDSASRRCREAGQSSMPLRGRLSRGSRAHCWRQRCSNASCLPPPSAESCRSAAVPVTAESCGQSWPTSRVGRTHSPRLTLCPRQEGRPARTDSAVLPRRRSWSTSLSRRRLRNLLRRGRRRHTSEAPELLGRRPSPERSRPGWGPHSALPEHRHSAR